MIKENKREFYNNKMQELSSKLDDIIDNSLQNPEALKKLTDHFRIDGLYQYSFINTMMIAFQGGRIAQSYKNWLKLDRNVKKGEHAYIYIFRPNMTNNYICYKCAHNEYKKSDLRKHFVNAHSITDKKVQDKLTNLKSYFNYDEGFSLSPVFSVDQTEGEELKYNHNSSDIINLDFDQITEKIKDVYGYETVTEITGTRRGYVSTDNIIRVSSMSNETDKIKVLMHELAHKRLGHTKDTCKLSERAQEVEAEAVALVVSGFLGADIELQEAYIENWKSEDAIKQVRRKKIISVSEKIIKKCLGLKAGKEIIEPAKEAA